MEAGMNLAIDYQQWKEEYESTLEDFSNKNVVVLFSGGKDSSLALDFMARAQKELGFYFKAHAGAFPVHRYPDNEKKKITSYWNGRGIDVQWHDLGKTDEYIESESNPCLKCQKLRKQMLKTILGEMVDDWENLVIVTGYSLWDIVSYSIEHILHDLFSNSMDSKGTARFMETAQRFYPLLRMKEGYTVFRPLIKHNSNNIQKTIRKAGIPTLSISCKFNEFRPKILLEKYYQKAGIDFDYNEVFNFATRSLGLPDIETYTSIDRDEYLQNIF